MESKLPVDQFMFVSGLINELKHGVDDDFRSNAIRRAEELKAKIAKRNA